jgi:hypothetical protein
MSRKKYKEEKEECRVFSTRDRFVSCTLSREEKEIYKGNGDDEGCYQKIYLNGKEVFRCPRLRRLNG